MAGHYAGAPPVPSAKRAQGEGLFRVRGCRALSSGAHWVAYHPSLLFCVGDGGRPNLGEAVALVRQGRSGFINCDSTAWAPLPVSCVRTAGVSVPGPRAHPLVGPRPVTAGRGSSGTLPGLWPAGTRCHLYGCLGCFPRGVVLGGVLPGVLQVSGASPAIPGVARLCIGRGGGLAVGGPARSGQLLPHPLVRTCLLVPAAVHDVPSVHRRCLWGMTVTRKGLGPLPVLRCTPSWGRHRLCPDQHLPHCASLRLGWCLHGPPRVAGHAGIGPLPLHLRPPLIGRCGTLRSNGKPWQRVDGLAGGQED